MFGLVWGERRSLSQQCELIAGCDAGLTPSLGSILAENLRKEAEESIMLLALHFDHS